MNPRWIAWRRAEGLTAPEAVKEPWAFMLWVDKHLTIWAKSVGFESDPSLSLGVVVRTQTEANRAALAQKGGQDAFTAYLESLVP